MGVLAGGCRHRLVERAPPDGARRWVEVFAGDDRLAILCIDDDARGPAFGGIRTRRYPSLAEAGADVRRLARAMTRKCRLARLPAGGAKMVVPWTRAHDRLGRREVFDRIGRAVEALGGRYVCGPDVGTREEDLDVVRSITRHVNPAGNDPGRATALGVRAAMDAAVEQTLRRPGAAACRVAVEGAGAVGGRLARDLLADGAHVLVADLDERRLRAMAEAGAQIVSCETIRTEPADVFAPCALGGLLTAALASRLRCRIVCGSANNQLAAPEVAAALARRGVVYVPDEVASAGAVIEGVYTVLDPGVDRARVAERIRAIGETTREVLARARRAGSTVEAVEDLLRAR